MESRGRKLLNLALLQCGDGLQNKNIQNVPEMDITVASSSIPIDNNSSTIELQENHVHSEVEESGVNNTVIIASNMTDSDNYAIINELKNSKEQEMVRESENIFYTELKNVDVEQETDEPIIYSDADESSFTDPYSDSGSEYKPNHSSASSHEILSSSDDENQRSVNPDTENISNNTLTGRTSDDENPRSVLTGRKRTRKEDCWRRNKIKSLRNRGKSYTNWRNKKVEERKMKEACSDKCRLKCKTKFSEEQRLKIFEEYWKLADVNRQRDFILRFVDFHEKKRCRIRTSKISKKNGDRDSEEKKGQNTKETIEPKKDENGKENNDINNKEEPAINNEEKACKRNFSYFYHLPANTARIKICQTFFLNTLAISQQVVKTVAKKSNKCNVVQSDKRGKVQCNSKLPNSVKETVRNHIKSFNPVESHYCRKETLKTYLPSNLNVSKMFELYKSYCFDNNIKNIASESIYRQIFNTEFNISFHIPKKDQCDFCTKYNNSSENEKQFMEEEMKRHLNHKEISRNQKEQDKQKSKDCKEFCAAVYDLQQVLQCPKAEVSQLYYKRKLAAYNLSIYDMGMQKGYCFMWHEAIAGRGACEIGSCVYNFISSKVAEGVKEFSFYSDNCTGQNRNRFIYCMYMYCASKYNIIINHTFLEKGHTQNEGDSIHSTVERAARNIPVYTPSQWYTVVRTANRKKPYIVEEMTTENFFDFKELLLHTTKNWERNERNDKVKWQNIKTVRVEPDNANILLYKYNLEELWIRIDTTERIRLQRIHFKDYVLKQLRLEGLPISEAKHKDLIHLCNEKVIPTEYQFFFKNLKFVNRIVDSESE